MSLLTNYYIVTGASRGLGRAIAGKLLAAGNHVTCISRTLSDELQAQAADSGAELRQLRFDLNEVERIGALMDDVFAGICHESAASLVLINNAGVLAPIKPAGQGASEDIIAHMRINVTAPILLGSEFLARTAGLRADKQIINISSGAGKKPYAGWSCYSSAKAALDMFTRCAGLEQRELPCPATVVSVAPGVVDTDMQAQIRASREEDFPSIGRFVALKEEGGLLSAETAADYIVRVIAMEKENGAVLDVRTLSA